MSGNRSKRGTPAVDRHTLAQSGTERHTPEAAAVYAQLKPSRATWVQSAAGPASDVARRLERGGRLFGVTKGQYGLTELLLALLDVIGPAEVDGWAWSMAPDDAKLLKAARADGRVTSLRLLFDRSFPMRHPEWVPMLHDALGNQLFATNNHAKLVLVAGDGWKVVVGSSMNFNINRRFEHFHVEDSPDVYGHFRELTDWMCARITPGLHEIVGRQFHEAFKESLGGGVAVAPVGARTGEFLDGDIDDVLALLDGPGLDVDELLRELEG